MEAPTNRAVEAVWRIESARLLGGLVRIVRDVELAEDLAQDALVTALERWPATGIPDNPGAWLMATAKNRAIDALRRQQMLERKHAAIGRDASAGSRSHLPDVETAFDQDVGDDLLRLILIACHPVLSAQARTALTLRLVAGLATDEIARAFLVPEPTLRSYHLLPSARADLLFWLGRPDEARIEFERAASLAQNARERERLLARAVECGSGGRS